MLPGGASWSRQAGRGARGGAHAWPRASRARRRRLRCGFGRAQSGFGSARSRAQPRVEGVGPRRSHWLSQEHGGRAHVPKLSQRGAICLSPLARVVTCAGSAAASQPAAAEGPLVRRDSMRARRPAGRIMSTSKHREPPTAATWMRLARPALTAASSAAQSPQPLPAGAAAWVWARACIDRSAGR